MFSLLIGRKFRPFPLSVNQKCLCFHSNNFDVGPDPDISLADMYRWKVSAYAPCSSTCTTGEAGTTLPLDHTTPSQEPGLLVWAAC